MTMTATIEFPFHAVTTLSLRMPASLIRLRINRNALPCWQWHRWIASGDSLIEVAKVVDYQASISSDDDAGKFVVKTLAVNTATR